MIFQEINHPAGHPHTHGNPISQQLSCISLDKMQEDCPFLGAAARSSRDATKPPDDSRDSRSSHAHQLRGFLGFRGETPMDMCHDQNKTILLSPNEKAWSIYFHKDLSRTFWSQTSDNMDRWKAQVGRIREEKRREEKKKEDQRRERVRKKKMQVREKEEKSQITAFFRWFLR